MGLHGGPFVVIQAMALGRMVLPMSLGVSYRFGEIPFEVCHFWSIEVVNKR